MSRRITPNSNVEMTKADKELTKEVTGKMIVTNIYGQECSVLIRDNRLVSAHFTDKSRVGSVYIGRINNIASNIDACFVDIGGEICFLPMKKAANPNIRNRVFDGKLKAGDEIAVKIIREAQKTKQASVTADFKLLEDNKPKFLHGSLHSCISSVASTYHEKWANLFRPSEYSEIVTDIPSVYTTLQAEFSASDLKIRLYEDTLLSLDKLFGITDKLNTALNARIWLKSGGYLVVDITEALTVIDVNSGKYEAKKGNGAQTSVLINREAAKEIARLLRLRNLSGIVLIDFINMPDKDEETRLLEYLNELTADDICPVRVVDMTALGLVELTRKKVAKPLHEQIKPLH